MSWPLEESGSSDVSVSLDVCVWPDVDDDVEDVDVGEEVDEDEVPLDEPEVPLDEPEVPELEPLPPEDPEPLSLPPLPLLPDDAEPSSPNISASAAGWRKARPLRPSACISSVSGQVTPSDTERSSAGTRRNVTCDGRAVEVFADHCGPGTVFSKRASHSNSSPERWQVTTAFEKPATPGNDNSQRQTVSDCSTRSRI